MRGEPRVQAQSSTKRVAAEKRSSPLGAGERAEGAVARSLREPAVARAQLAGGEPDEVLRAASPGARTRR